MKALKYFIILSLALSVTDAQDIKKDGKKPTTFTYAEALEMIKQRDAEWKGKIAKADSLITSQKAVIGDCENLVMRLEDSANADSLLLMAKDSQIKLLKTRDEANEKLVKLVEPKWYENQYLWLGIGFVLGKI